MRIKTVSIKNLFFLPVPVIGALAFVPSCYFDWNEIQYVEACEPLSPTAGCPANHRCLPQKEGDPVCEGPAGNDNQDGYCTSNDDCGILEVCTGLSEFLPSKICTTLCRTDADCLSILGYEEYGCARYTEMTVRGETWGTCAAKSDEKPPGWHCDLQDYAGKAFHLNELCNCGCGVFDPDCPDNEDESCEMCEPEFAYKCVPEGWNCPDAAYHNGECDCGCGVVDHGEDCPTNSRESCENCPTSSCGIRECGTTFDVIDLDDNSKCKEVPPNWTCPDEAYQDGANCNCGCGVVDEDCDGFDNIYCSADCPEESCGYDAGCEKTAFKETDNSQCVN